MHWYGGSIAEAVNLSKVKNAIFVVFVEGDNELSIEMAATIDDAAIVSRLSDQTNFLAVKLKSGTANYTHFAQIYQFVPVPSLFFIGRNGTPLEVVCAGVQASNLATRIDRILQEHHTDKPRGSIPSTSSSSHSLREATSGLLQAEGEAGAASAPVSIPSPAKTSTLPEAPSPPKFPKPSELAAPPSPLPPQAPPSPPTTNKPDTSADKIVTPDEPVIKTPSSKSEHEVVCDGDVCFRRPKGSDQPSTSNAPVTVAPSLGTPLPTFAATQLSEPLEPSKPVEPAEPVDASNPAEPRNAVEPCKLVEDSKPVEETKPVETIKPVEPMSSDTSVEERLERAKELLEAKRREKAEKEKELERQKELERRNLGQGVAELKRWQADQEMKQIQEERKREKLENDLARQRILEQIAQDRAERRAKDLPAAPPASQAEQPEQQASSHLATAGDGTRASPSARVQFKLPDGTSHTAHFDAHGTLGHVQSYVADNLQLSSSNFALWTAFPRRELTDTTATLRELELAPSAALLVLPRRSNTPTSGPTQYFSVYAFITTFLATYLYNPSVAMFTWLRERLFPPPAVGPRTPGVTVIAPTGTPLGGAGVPANPRGNVPRRRTNIHRLPGDAANDDDNNTWNGNSTQQM